MGIRIGESGYQTLTTQPVAGNLNAPLAALPTGLVPQSGAIYVGMTNTATGARSVTRIDVDVTSESLNDLAAKLDAVGNMQAVLDTSNGSLRINADVGFTFDFSTQIQSQADALLPTSTAQPQFEGNVTSGVNGVLEVTTRGTGTIGQSPNLTVEVFDQTSNTVTTLNVGQGYTPGTPLALPNGVQISFPAGDIVNGESVLVETAGMPDETGLLGSLGFNPIFVGEGAHDLAVNPDLLASPSLLATSGNGQPGNDLPLLKMIELQNTGLFDDGLTLSEYIVDMQAEAGNGVHQAELDQQAASAVLDNLQQQRDAISGVDPNEEMVRLLEYQRMFQAGAQVIRVVQETTDEVLNLIR